jgi:hypothetical protein
LKEFVLAVVVVLPSYMLKFPIIALAAPLHTFEIGRLVTHARDH